MACALRTSSIASPPVPFMQVDWLRPEARAILAAAHSRDEVIDHTALGDHLRQVGDWDFFLRAVRWHNVGGVVHHALKPHAEVLPDPVIETLREGNQLISQHNLLLAGEVMRVIRAFEEAGVPVVPLKGPALAAAIYSRFSLRPAGDIDFLVRPDDLKTAAGALSSLGYRSITSHTEAKDLEAAQLGREFVNEERGVVAELHGYFLNTVHQFELEPEAVWTRLGEANLDGRQIPRLSAEDTMLYLCAHGGKHRYERLKWLCDIAELLRADVELSWPVLRARAKKLRSQRLLWLGCLLSHELLQAPVPGDLIEEAKRDQAVPGLARQVTEWLFTEPFSRDPSVASYRFHLQMREDWRDRRNYLAHLSRLALKPTEKDRAFLQLPEKLDPLYYLVRPVRLIRDAIFS